jgi:pimeloyl-ACP methyl ester carboxylesterase
MPAVLVHGVPDTAAVWAPVVAELTRDDVIAISLPGFAAPLPDRFAATKDEYAAWLADEVAALDGPVDLVGHDWGSLITQHLALTRPELMRSFTMINGAITDRFTWHDLAVQWQTPGLGEQIMELMVVEPVTAALRAGGHPDPAAAATAVDETMKRCILALYRSAVDVGREWSPSGPAERPGLVIWGRDDPYAPPASARRFAAVTATRVVFLDGGHWGAFALPGDTVEALQQFWAELG